MRDCAFEDCVRPSWCRDYCRGHYTQWFRGRGMRPLSNAGRNKDVNGQRPCKRCGEQFPATLEFFYAERGGLTTDCRPCKNLAGQAWVKAHPEQYRQTRRRARAFKYGLTEGDLDALEESQGGCCAICGRTAKLVIDHNHSSGTVRGLLCAPCNGFVGFLDADSSTLERLNRYMH